MRRATLFAIALLFTTHFASACSEFATMMPTTINYPETNRVEVVSDIPQVDQRNIWSGWDKLGASNGNAPWR